MFANRIVEVNAYPLTENLGTWAVTWNLFGIKGDQQRRVFWADPEHTTAEVFPAIKAAMRENADIGQVNATLHVQMREQAAEDVRDELDTMGAVSILGGM